MCVSWSPIWCLVSVRVLMGMVMTHLRGYEELHTLCSMMNARAISHLMKLKNEMGLLEEWMILYKTSLLDDQLTSALVSPGESSQPPKAACGSWTTGWDAICLFLMSIHLLDHFSGVTENNWLPFSTGQYSINTHLAQSCPKYLPYSFHRSSWRGMTGSPPLHKLRCHLFGEAFPGHPVCRTYPCVPLYYQLACFLKPLS